MRRFVPLFIVAALAGAGFMYMFKREMVMEQYEGIVLGFPAAKTPEKCVEGFNKAIQDRNYKMLAKYCTKDYADLLMKSADAGKEVGKAIDDVTFRMQKDGVLTKEIEAVLYLNDPLPKAVTATMKSSSENSAVAVLSTTEPSFDLGKAGVWDMDLAYVQGFYAGQIGFVKMVKEGAVWKFDLPVNPGVRDRFGRVFTVHMDYVNAFKKMSEEVRVERTTKEDVAKRLKELMTEAVRAKQ